LAEPVTTEEKPAALSPELAALQAEAIALEGEQAAPAADGGEPGIAPTPPIDYLSDAKGLVDIAAEALAAFYPSTAPILTTEKRGRIAGALAPVLEKYGLDMAGIFGKWGAEIGLAFACAPIAIPLAQAIRADRAAVERLKIAEAPPPPPAGPTAATTAAPPASDLYSKV
jgi:hypothetical protein